jgi:hypothetical protein
MRVAKADCIKSVMVKLVSYRMRRDYGDNRKNLANNKSLGDSSIIKQ